MDLKNLLDSCQAFVPVFYSTVDKKRHILYKLYHENATLLWNGNQYQEFYEKLPHSEHQTDALNVLPITPMVTNGQQSATLYVHGLVKYDQELKHTKKIDSFGFHQYFILIAEGDKWKIVSDSVRTHDVDNK